MPVPQEALIAVTYRCNARCHMCNTWQNPSAKEEEITPSHLESLPGVRFCNITGGEPFMRDDIEDIIRVMNKKARRIVISTNGYFSDRIIRLAEKYPRLGVRVSIEGLPAVNDKLRGLKDGFDHGIRTLMDLHRLGVKDIGFGITLSDDNILDLTKLYELSKAMNMEFATACVHNTYYFHKFDNRITRIDDFNVELKKLVIDLLRSKRVKNWFRAYFNHGLINYVNGGKRLLPCEAGRNFFFIIPTGEVMPCNAMHSSMGNIKEAPFDTIWNSTKAQEVRKKTRNCDKQCWMIGSAAPAIKKYISAPAIWVLKNKIRMALGLDAEQLGS